MPAAVGLRGRIFFAATAIAVSTFSACRIGTDLKEEEQGTLLLDEARTISAAYIRTTVENTVLSPVQAVFYHSHGPPLQPAATLHSHPRAGPFVHEGTPGPLPSGHNLFNEDFSFDLTCAAGGTLVLAAAAVGEGNPLIQQGFIDYEIGHDPLECAILVDGGDRIVLRAPPYVTGAAHVSNDGAGSAEISGTLVGGTAWEAQAKAGECLIDLAFAGSAATVGEISEVTVTGTVCEIDVGGTLVLD